MKPEDFLWIEKYRPKVLSEIILPTRIKNIVKSFLKKKEIPHLIFYSYSPGTGKTSLAKIITNELKTDYLLINASNENGIDILRYKIDNFCNIKPSKGKNRKIKIVILDEAERLTSNMQDALKSYLEKVNKHIRFIFTCNQINQLIDPLKSRCHLIDFNFTKQEEKDIKILFLKRCIEILENENIDYDKKVLANLVKNFYPDLRRIINDLQYISLEKGEVKNIESIVYDKNEFILLLRKLQKSIKTKKDIKENYEKLRLFVLNNFSLNPYKIFIDLYQILKNELLEISIPELIILIADYQFKMINSIDKEICIMGCLIEIIKNCEFKEATIYD